jgi:hypothetical protein
MSAIESIITEVYDGDADIRHVDRIVGLMIHRVGVDLQSGVVLGYDARSICDAFLGRAPRWAEVAKITGSENAYTLFVGGDLGPAELDGHIWQALPLDELGHHARRFSGDYLGIGCIGDFRERPPSPKQLANLVSICADLCLALGLGAAGVVGHGEIRGAHGGAKAPGKPAACPGDLLGLDGLRSMISEEMAISMRAGAVRRLASAGLLFP